MSFDEIRIKSIRAAQNLQKRGYKRSQVVGIIAKNSHHLAPGILNSKNGFFCIDLHSSPSCKFKKICTDRKHH